HAVAMRLFVMGRIGILDLMSAVTEKNNAKRGFIKAMQTYWSLYYTLRSMTAYDFENKTELTNEGILLK
ncbi:MAG: TolC family protein, partial [Muribaculaceae bacterium]|nr:TolC family protein [Muribaculaceae bacterium]